jgi:1-acyl-sn-glycerol-3-phosphate acyltransferase
MIIVTPLGMAAFLLSFLGLKKQMSFAMYKIAQGWARLIILLSGCRLSVRGLENIPKKGGICFVANHGSIFDIPLLLAYAGRPFGFIAKKELIWVPFINMWISVLGGFFLDRKNIRSAIKTIDKGIQNIRKGGAMIIFPEGHRSRGQGLLPFKAGAFKLATQSDAVIVPVAIRGSYAIFEQTGVVQSVAVSLAFTRTVDTAALPKADRKQHLADNVYALIAESLEL